MKPDNHDVEEVRRALKEVFPPVSGGPGRDLWPAMLRRMSEDEEGDEGPVLRAAPWYDWVLAGGLLALALLFPKLILVMVYHL